MFPLERLVDVPPRPLVPPAPARRRHGLGGPADRPGRAVGAAGSSFGNSPLSQDTDSARATALLQKGASSAAGKSGRVVWQVSDGKVTDGAAERAMTGALERIADAPGVASVTDPYTPAGKAQVSKDGRTAYATVADDDGVEDARIDEVKDLATAPESERLHIALNGQAFTVNPEPNAVADAMGIVLTFIVLLFVIRAVWVAAVPIITAIAGVGTSAVAVILLSHAIPLSDTTLTLGSLIGLGVGIDYALFIVNRHRGNLSASMGVAESVAKSLNTSGRAVVFAGLTVVVALLGMLTLNVGIINGMAIGAAITVVLTVLAAVTLLPALLGMIGPRILGRAERRALADPERLATLTPRERQVMTLVATGLSNDEIAERLFVTPVTVKTHANRAMAKLGARDRAQLVVMAYESGLVRAGETRT
ncbi:MMPL family transporter [Streptomyces sp. AK010]|uniref:MMPL family transporter n=1 Tax=Streptomyces sp. AK010 TaxID=2723074 RepID=UPI0017CE53A4|nr:MMPL family transporter [Streptomyces sp. AK010]MBB6417557.1 putative membrane protein YdfJ with MMPL/SSD domain [Streptomyces sp. AK010]